MKFESTIEVGNFSIILERINAVGKLLLEVEKSVICRLETYIGNKLDWKHLFRLETISLDWKQKKYIGNNLFRLETKKRTLETIFLDWKQNKYIGNNHFRLET